MENQFKPVGKPKTLLPVVLIIVVVFLVYLPTLNCGFVWDDDMNITDNLNFRGLSASHLYWMFTTFHDGNYHALCWMTFGFDFVMWGLNPTGYHLTNLVLHILNTVLFYYLIVMFLLKAHISSSESRLSGIHISAFIGALFFSIHPLRVESVAWISTRGDVLCAFFYIMAVIAYLKRAQKEDDDDRRKWFVISLAFFILSLLSRAWGITFPVVILILDAYPLRRFVWKGRFSSAHKMLLIEKIPYALLALGAGILAFLAKRGSMLVVTEYGILNRIVQAAYGLSFYISKTLFPVGLSPLYSLEKNFNPMDLKYILCGFLIFGVTAGLVVMRHQRPWAITSWFCYAVIVSPLLGFAQTGPQIAADRYTYISCLPFGILVGAGIYRLWIARQNSALPSAGWHAAVTGSLVCLALLSFLSLYQVRIWKDRGVFWSRVIQLYPDNPIAYNDRGNFYKEQGNMVRALEDYKIAIQLKPDFAKAFYNRALLREKMGDTSGAIADHSDVIRFNSKHARAYNNRGALFKNLGQIDRALSDFDSAIRINPFSPEAYANRGVIRQAQNDLKRAIQDFSKTLEVASVHWPSRAWVEQLLDSARKRLSQEDKTPDYR
jgi:hypothetical protein